ncbi:translation initiation factor IF-2-like [Leopardus geoffroyi]|uniref:translation initiation factor IF-2-like n=1 Tax=Leopardus geoffroyi TaxID=46844 RepID=UPI001E25ED51|nr:translation initiation factor IF-2-like [Leopardus geoffroyi]
MKRVPCNTVYNGKTCYQSRCSSATAGASRSTSICDGGWKWETVRLRPPANQALPNLTCTSKAAVPAALPPAPGAANPRFPRAGLSSGPCNQPSQARTGPGRPARPQRPLDPRQQDWAWAPAATAPPTRAREERVRPTRYASPRPTCRGKRGSWTAATGPRAGAQAAGARPRDPKYPWWCRAGTHAGGLPRASAARRGGRGDLALPSAPVHRRRRHFAFHSVVSPPPHSAAGFPDVGISRRRLRGGRGLGASVRPAASSQRAACGLPPSPVVLSSACWRASPRVAPAWRWPVELLLCKDPESRRASPEV